ncbi:MAG TPA: 16S rRNA (guanine(527)-N(7))-methyltransferase RsmG [Tenericutes bacterium]|nr:16S rRNA (guanine(527)-N(7))-methyltransferase RsmG [Mycoplasmatota bacterium]
MTNKEFIEELEKIGIKITEKMEIQLEKYYDILIEKNKYMNLTGITEKKQVYLKHFYDSATIYKIIDLNKIDTLCDIGTGAGFPGMVLKILFPKLKVTLVDSLNKRVEFLKDVINKLELNNIEVFHERAEVFANNNREKFDVVTARAVAPLNVLVEYCIPMIKKNSFFIPMKANISQEMQESENALKKLNCKIINSIEFLLPKENSIRTILLIRKEKETSKIYPRKFSEIKKNPL